MPTHSMTHATEDACTERHKAIDQRLEQHETNIAKLFEMIADIRDRLANRPPVWATLLIGLLMGVCGVLLGLAFAS